MYKDTLCVKMQSMCHGYTNDNFECFEMHIPAGNDIVKCTCLILDVCQFIISFICMGHMLKILS